MALQQHSLRDLHESYQWALRVIEIYKSKMSGVFEVWSAQKLVQEFETRALNALVQVSEHAIAVAKRKNDQKNSKWSEWVQNIKALEDFAHKYSNSVAHRMKLTSGEFMNMDALLDEVIKTEAEILSRGSIQIPVRIFSAGTHQGIAEGNGEWLSEMRTAAKYESLIRVLSKWWVDVSKLIVAVETLKQTQMRSIPYRVIWMQNPLRTICISDEIGERTYIYRGYIDIAWLATHQKWEPIQGLQAVGVTYSEGYESSLTKAIFGEKENLAHIQSNTISEYSSMLPSSDIIGYQCALLAHKSELAEAGIILSGGVWYLDRKSVV